MLMKTITLYVDENQYQELKTYARKERRSVSSLVRELMVTYNRERQAEARISPLDERPVWRTGVPRQGVQIREDLTHDFFDRP